MKRYFCAFAVFAALTLAVSAGAGDSKRCSASTQDCLNHMAKSLENRGWVGIEMDDTSGDGTMVITKVIEESPAETAGFQVGDALYAVNGITFSEDNQKLLQDMKYAMTPGAEFTYTVSRRGSKVDLDVTLGELPESVRAQWIGYHMLDHAEVQQASNE